MPSKHFERACQIAYHGNTFGSVLPAMLNLMKYYQPDLLACDFPFALNGGKIDNTAVRTILWSILASLCKGSLAFLRPYDMGSENFKFMTLLQSLNNFMVHMNAESFFHAKHVFSAFVDDHWIKRPLLLKFNFFYATQMTTFFGIHVLRLFQTHMMYLVDIDFADLPVGSWTTPQFIYSKILFKLPTNTDQYPSPHESMAVYPIEKLLSDVWVFNYPWRKLETMCDDYLRNYVIYIRATFDKRMLLEVSRTIQRQHYTSIIEHALNFTKLVLINIADKQAPHHNYVCANAYTFIFERFYDQFIQHLFEAEVAAIVPADQSSCIRATVRGHWLTHPPPIVNEMTQLHLKYWGNFYTNAFLGL